LHLLLHTSSWWLEFVNLHQHLIEEEHKGDCFNIKARCIRILLMPYNGIDEHGLDLSLEIEGREVGFGLETFIVFDPQFVC